MKCLSSILLLAALWVLPGLAFGLGFGDLQQKSSLNEPFEARIPLVGVGEEDLDSVRVRLATPAEFDQAHLPRPYVLDALKFEVVKPEGEKPYIRISSAVDIREPYLSFLVELTWKKGRLNREFTVLLDPPRHTVQPKRAKGEQEAPLRQPKEAVERPRARPHAAAHGPRIGAKRGARAKGSYRTVGGDTAWEIAAHHRPHSVSIQQMMLALLRANPDAFVGDNINNLRRGAVMRMPSKEEIRSLSLQDAIAEVERHHSLWLAYRGKAAAMPARRGGAVPAVAPTGQVAGSAPAVPTHGALPAGTPGASGPGAPEGEARLKLLAAADGKQQGEGASGTSRLAEEYARTSEVLETLRSENNELKKRLGEDDSTIQAMKRKIELTSTAMAELQERLAKEKALTGKPQAAPSAPEPVKAASPAVAEQPKVLTPEKAPEKAPAVPEPPVAATPKVEAPASPAAAPAVPVAPVAVTPPAPAVPVAPTTVTPPPAPKPPEPIVKQPAPPPPAAIPPEVQAPVPATPPIQGPAPAPAPAKGATAPAPTALAEAAKTPPAGQGEKPIPPTVTVPEAGNIDLTPANQAGASSTTPTEKAAAEKADAEKAAAEKAAAEKADAEKAAAEKADADKAAAEKPAEPGAPAGEEDNTLLWMAGGGGGLLLIIVVAVVFVLRRRRAAKAAAVEEEVGDQYAGEFAEFHDDATTADLRGALPPPVVEAPKVKAKAKTKAKTRDEPLGEKTVIAPKMEQIAGHTEFDLAEEHKTMMLPPGVEPAPAPARAPEEDPLAEVNVYLAYEDFDKAEGLCKKIIAQYPGNAVYMTRLLEVYYASGNKSAYEKVAKEVYDLLPRNDPLWGGVLAMWYELSPNRQLFSAEVEEAPVSTEVTGGGGGGRNVIDLTETAGAAMQTGEVEALDLFEAPGAAMDLGVPEPAPDAGILDLTSSGARAADEDLDRDLLLLPGEEEPMLDLTGTGVGVEIPESGLELDFAFAEPAPSAPQAAPGLAATFAPPATREEVFDITGAEGEEGGPLDFSFSAPPPIPGKAPVPQAASLSLAPMSLEPMSLAPMSLAPMEEPEGGVLDLGLADSELENSRPQAKPASDLLDVTHDGGAIDASQMQNLLDVTVTSGGRGGGALSLMGGDQALDLEGGEDDEGIRDETVTMRSEDRAKLSLDLGGGEGVDAGMNSDLAKFLEESGPSTIALDLSMGGEEADKNQPLEMGLDLGQSPARAFEGEGAAMDLTFDAGIGGEELARMLQLDTPGGEVSAGTEVRSPIMELSLDFGGPPSEEVGEGSMPAPSRSSMGEDAGLSLEPMGLAPKEDGKQIYVGPAGAPKKGGPALSLVEPGEFTGEKRIFVGGVAAKKPEAPAGLSLVEEGAGAEKQVFVGGATAGGGEGGAVGEAPADAGLSLEFEIGAAGEAADALSFDFEGGATGETPAAGLSLEFETGATDETPAAELSLEFETGATGEAADALSFDFETGGAGETPAAELSLEFETGATGEAADALSFDFDGGASGETPATAGLSLEFEVEGESSGFTESGTYALPIVDEDLEFEGGTGESAADAGLSLEFDGVDTGEAPAVGGISLDFDQSYSNMSLEFEGAPEGEGLSGAGPGGGDDFMMEFQPTIASGAAGDRPEGFESLSMPGEDEEDIFGMKTVLLPKRKGGEDRQSTQEVGDTRINLARAYIDMGQKDEARALLHEVLQEGTDNQRHEAEEMMRGLS